MAHVLIAAAHKSSGKTTISLGIAGALRRRGVVVQPFKKGPDYIDPMWLAKAAGRPCFNLDFNTMSNGEIADLFASKSSSAMLGLIESNKGLYDGVDLEGSDSNAALAKLLKAPVVLVIDSTGTTRGIAPLLQGYQVFDPEVKIAGIILNMVGGPRHEGKLRAAIKHYTNLPVLGAVGRDEKLIINERHLGLTTPGEVERLETQLEYVYDTIEAGVDIDRILEIASLAAEISEPDETMVSAPLPKVRIGIARDSAFTYYYPDDLAAIEQAGAELIPFNTLSDAVLPDVDGLFFGGGFPETHMQALEANESLRADIGKKLENGMPAYAECGGLMYLCNSLSWHGETRKMVGAIDGDAVMCARPQGRGYSVLQRLAEFPWNNKSGRAGGYLEGSIIPAHEFHFARIENLSRNTVYGYKVIRGNGIDGENDGIIYQNLVAGFCHQRHTEANPWATNFVNFVKEFKQGAN